MESTLRLERKHAFVLSEADLKKVWNSLEESFGAVSVDVGFTDNIEIKVDSLEQLLSFENSKKSSIKRIEFNAIDEKRENRGTATFENVEYRSIQIKASGNYEIITRFGDTFEEIIDGLKPWYSRLCKLDFFFIFFIIGCVVFTSFTLLLMTIPDAPEHKSIELSKAIMAYSITLSAFGLIVLAAWGLNKVRSYCFPIASFAIGQGKERHRVMENIRWGVVVAFAVSFSASAVFGLLG